MAELDLLLTTGEGLNRLLTPLQEALADEDEFAALLGALGWQVDPATFDIDDVRGALAITGDATIVTQRLGEIVGAPDAVDPAKYVELVEAVVRIIGRLRALAGTPPPAGIPQDAWATLCAGLLAELLARHVVASQPGIYALLVLAGIVDEEDVAAGGAPGRVPYVRRSLNWGRLGTMLSDPPRLARELYGWGDAGQPPKLDVLVARGGRAMQLIGLPAQVAPPAASRLDTYFAPGSPHRATAKELGLTVFDGRDATGNRLALGLGILPIPPPTDRSGPPRGIVIAPTVQVSASPPLDVFWPFSIDVKGPQAAYTGARLELLPGSARVDLGSAADVTVDAHVRLSRDVPTMLVGSMYSTRLDLLEYSVAFGVRGTLADPDVSIEVAMDKARLTVDLGEADGFLSKILGPGIKPIDLELALAWSSKTGLQVRAGGALEIVIPLNIALGVVAIDSLTIRADASTATGVALTAGIAGSLTLGPVQASVLNVGVKTSLKPVPAGQPSGTFGDLDLAFGFKPPDGLGMSVDAAVVKGGGFLLFAPERHEYAGVLELSLKDVVQLKAIGLLTTRLPGGEPGFSLLLIITGQFPPIQLGFGFVLTGVGGLAGINRTVAIEPLRNGVRNRTLDSILFPEDPVRNAPRIISDLRTVFPPAAGRYVFGPMIELGWGTPTLITARIGVLLELPAPVRLLLLGQIKAALPAKELALVELNLDVVGGVDFEKGELFLDATIYDSRILVYSLSGDMALRINWGEQPAFALSLGGFHPRFTPPPNFPALRRMTLALGAGDNPRLACEAYLALTSNSAQLGARVMLHASAAGFTVRGQLGFDVLIVFSPFSFEAAMEAGVEVLRGSTVLMSVHLAFTLSGPTPWRARGSASFKILLLSVSVGFDVSWGDPQQALLPPADARQPLLTAIADARSWSGALPPFAEHGVSLSTTEAESGVVVVHPLARMTMRQRVVPLDVTISRFGNAPPERFNRFVIESVTIGGTPATGRTPVTDRFARGQFFEMTEDDKLSKPAFEPMTAGFTLGATQARQGHASPIDVHYETNIVDKVEAPSRKLVRRYKPSANMFGAQIRSGAAELSQVLNSGESKFVTAGARPQVATADIEHVVVDRDTLVVRTDILAAAGTMTAAEQALADAGAAARNLQVMALHEVRGS